MGDRVKVIMTNFESIDTSRVLLGNQCRLCGKHNPIIKVRGSKGDVFLCSVCMADMVGDYCHHMGITLDSLGNKSNE